MERKSSDPHASSRAIGDIIRKGSIITVITLVSRPLGYVREAVQAYLFGATLLVDAFIVAFNFPEMIQTLFFSGATSAFLVPVCTRYVKDRQEYSRIYSTFINLSLAVTVVLSVLLLLLSGPVVRLIAPGFTETARGVTRYLFIIMIPVIALHTLLSVMKAFLNAKDHFAAPEMSGILWNLIFILGALLLHPYFGIYSLAIGVTAGSFVQVFMQVPYLRRLGVRYSPVMDLGHEAVREAKGLFAGALIATSIVPINSFVGRIIASYLPHGEVAALSYAFRIFILPFSLFAVPIYTVMFSKLSRLYHDRDWKGIHTHTDGSLVLLCITLVPSTILLCVMGDAFVKLLYERGAFTARDTLITARALFGYGTGLLFYALSISFVRIFNAFHDMKTPALVGITSILLNALIAALLMRPLGNLGISLATSLVSLYNFAVLFLLLKKRTGYRLSRATVHEIIRVLIAGIILALCLLFVRMWAHGRLGIALPASLIATAAISLLFFGKQYLALLKRRF